MKQKLLLIPFAMLTSMSYATAQVCNDHDHTHDHDHDKKEVEHKHEGHVHTENCSHSKTEKKEAGHVHTENCSHNHPPKKQTGHVHTENCSHGHDHDHADDTNLSTATVTAKRKGVYKDWRSTEKVDGAVALVMALDRAMKNLNTGSSVYDERGLLFI